MATVWRVGALALVLLLLLAACDMPPAGTAGDVGAIDAAAEPSEAGPDDDGPDDAAPIPAVTTPHTSA